MLSVNQLQVRLKEVVLDYNFSVNTGDIVTIQGRSGVGKTTLLNVIAGFEKAHSGEVLWKGASLLSKKVEQRPVSMLFQEHNLFEHLSVWQNLQFGLEGEDIAERLKQAASIMEVSGQLDKSPMQLSGGQRQRIAILRTLLRPEPLVLLDEPFAELDSTTRLIANDWVRDTAKATQKTVLLVTHQDEDVARVGDWNLVLGQ